MARRRRQNSAFPVRQPASAARASRLLALAALFGRMAACRMAAGRKRTDQILAFDLAGRCRPRDAVATAKMRWRIERDYQELKQELGLGHYEGRGWRGFHHHMALCVAAYGFLVSERSLIPPSGDKILLIPAPPLSPGYRPRGSANPSRTPHQSVNRNDPN